MGDFGSRHNALFLVVFGPHVVAMWSRTLRLWCQKARLPDHAPARNDHANGCTVRLHDACYGRGFGVSGGGFGEFQLIDNQLAHPDRHRPPPTNQGHPHMMVFEDRLRSGCSTEPKPPCSISVSPGRNTPESSQLSISSS